MKTKEVGFGIIGCGRIGKWHAKNIRKLPGLKLVGVNDCVAQACESLARKTKCRPFYDLDELFAHPDVEVVSICSPPLAHLPLIKRAASARKHVLVEKPLALSAEDAVTARKVCEEWNVLLGVVHQQRFRSACRALKRLLVNGMLGEVKLVSVKHTWHRPPSLERGSWRGDAAQGGGLLLDQAVHSLDLLIWFFGLPDWVSASIEHDFQKAVGAGEDARIYGAAEESAVATLGYRSGPLASFSASTSVNHAHDDISLEVSGTKGAFGLIIRDYDNADISFLDLARQDGERSRRVSRAALEALIVAEEGLWRKGPRSTLFKSFQLLAGSTRGAHPFRSLRGALRRQVDRKAQFEYAQYEGHAAVFASMAKAARGEEPFEVCALDAHSSLRMVEAIYRSHSAGGEKTQI